MTNPSRMDELTSAMRRSEEMKRSNKRTDRVYLIAMIIALSIALPILARLAWRIVVGE